MTRIYLVDDHVLVREGLRALLEAGGHEVVGESADAAQALVQIPQCKPDVLVLDMTLGEHSGLDLLLMLKERGLALPTLVLTMSTQPRIVSEAMRLGAQGYVLKGSTGRELLQAVDAVVHGQRHLGPGVVDLVAQALQAQGSADPLAALSPREMQILRMVVRGLTSATIGEQLHLSPKTVDTYRSRLMAKLGVGDMPALMRLAMRTGLVDPAEA
ncbi:response regulator [Azohydromonas aeria]|uniref:response regulator n=1 Tax=Azohydromonas aeria TaxID=2590212 RepID=UPI0012FA9E5E|nr:response regulator transcription factor [Azohydromonas aeria]